MRHEARQVPAWLIFDVGQNMKAISVTILILLGIEGHASESVAFVGYATTPSQTRFVLREVTSGAVSDWLLIGQAFRDYKIVSFESRTEVLTVASSSGPHQLRLEESKSTTPERGRYPYENPDKQPRNRVTVTGAVAEEGSLKPHSRTTVIDAIMAMGGVSVDANLSKVFLSRPVTQIRNGDSVSAIQLRLLDCTKSSDRAVAVLPGDIIHVQSKVE